MQIVTDGACDLAPEQTQGLNFHVIPLRLTLDGKTYLSGVDVQAAEFYNMLTQTNAMPTTTQPSAGEFAEVYRRLAQTDPEILSIHLASGLSGTINAARAGANLIPEAHVTVFDSRLLSAPLGWQVVAAARAVKAGWPLERTISMLEHLREQSIGMCTLQVLKYVIHGGRIGHLRGWVGSLLNIKPIITFDKIAGKTEQAGQDITFKRATIRMAELVTRWHKPGARLMVQLLYGADSSVIGPIRERLDQLFDCTWLPSHTLAPIFGCHSGPGVAGIAFVPQDAWAQIP